MTTVRDVTLTDGRTLRVHDSGADHDFVLLWHHGSPQTGALLAPVLQAAEAREIRLLSYGRPSYGGSTAHRGRDIGSAAGDVAQLLDAVGVGRFATMGASGGGPHGLACAALLGDRVTAAACLASPAPFSTGYDWFAGMASDGRALRAALEGREPRERFAETDEFDPASFNALDYAALENDWPALGADVQAAAEAGQEGLIDDDLALAKPWGFDVAAIGSPVLLAHGGDDRVIPASHSRWLLGQLRFAELWFRPRDGHIAVMNTHALAMDWLLEHADNGRPAKR